MIFKETMLGGAFVIDLERREDERGFFARSFCRREFEVHGIDPHIAQCNVSFNAKAGTLRGMHWQAPPFEEAKLVRCTRGAAYDVIIDLRSDSKTYKEWVGVALTAENRTMLYVPQGFAHGFVTRCDHTEIFYQMSQFYVPEAARGARYDDPAFHIRWPEKIREISDRDRKYPDFTGLDSCVDGLPEDRK
jgi:dTDP-4-dehydrorhamnose 3,5-epimerase